MKHPFQSTPETFDKLYRGEPAVEGASTPNVIPWDVHQAQPRLMELEALGGISGEVLDIGCGLGDNAIYMAARYTAISSLIDDGLVHLPFTVVHAHRVDTSGQ